MIDEQRFEEIVAGRGEQLTPRQATNLICSLCDSVCEGARNVMRAIDDRDYTIRRNRLERELGL